MQVSRVSKKLLNEVRLTVERENADPVDLTLVLDMNAIAKLEEQTGVDITNPDNWKSVKHSLLTSLVWAALDTHHSDEFSLREVRSWFQFGDSILRELFYALMGVKKDDAGKSQPQPEKTTEQAGAES